MNVTGFSHSGFTDGNSLMKVGFSAGGFVNLGISKHFSVQGELSFQYRHSEFEREHKGGCYRYWGVEIPLYAMSRYTFTNSGSILVGVGSYANFGLKYATSRIYSLMLKPFSPRRATLASDFQKTDDKV